MKPIYILMQKESNYDYQDTEELIFWVGEDINDARNIILEKLEKDVTFFVDNGLYRMFNTKEPFDYIYIQDSKMLEKYPPILPIKQDELEKLIEFATQLEEVINEIRQRNKDAIKERIEVANRKEYERLKKMFEGEGKDTKE